MTQSKNSSLIQLSEVFPTWAQEDLLNVLNEAGGDVYVAISRISEGHVSQWADGSKKAVISPVESFQDSRSSRTNRRDIKNTLKNDNRTQQRPISRESLKNRKPDSKTVETKNPIKSSGSSVDNSKTTTTAIGSLASATVSDSAPKASKTSFAEAAAQALAQKSKPKKQYEPKSETTEKSEKKTAMVAAASVVEEEPIKSESVPTSESVILEAVESAVSAVVETVTAGETVEVIEEEETVFMPARATPSLVMEQPAVVFPLRNNLRSNISVRFGYDPNGDEIVANVEKPSSPVSSAVLEEVQAFKTPITMSALESTFAMMSAASASKSPEPIMNAQVPVVAEPSAWESDIVGASVAAAASSSASPSVGSTYGNMNRGSVRHQQSWDYEQHPNPNHHHRSSAAALAGSQASFGPAPGFSNPNTESASPQRFVSRAAPSASVGSHYESGTPGNAYGVNNNNNSNNNNSSSSAHSRFPYDQETVVGGNGNNVSQYYTSRSSAQASNNYPVYRGGNSFNPSRYSSTNNRSYYQPQQAQHVHQTAGGSSVGSPGISQYTGYIPHQHQNYLNSYHHGYAPYPQQSDQYSSPQQQPYYQPYQPPNQYLSASHHHHHPHHSHHHHQQQQQHPHQSGPHHSQH